MSTVHAMRAGAVNAVTVARRVSKLQRRAMTVRKLKVSKRMEFEGKKVLLWEPAPFPMQIALLSSVATALKLRGAHVNAVLCDGTRQHCVGTALNNVAARRRAPRVLQCLECRALSMAEAMSFGIERTTIGALVSRSKERRLLRIARSTPREELYPMEYRGVSVGRHTRASLYRHYMDRVLERDWEDEVIRAHLEIALLHTEAAFSAIERFAPSFLLMTHAQYTAWGPACDVARNLGVTVKKVNSGYIPGTIKIRSFDKANGVGLRVPRDETWKEIEQQSLNTAQDEALERFMTLRYTKGGIDNVLRGPPRYDCHELRRKLGLRSLGAVWGIFPNVGWDAALQTFHKAFDSDEEWLVTTLRTIEEIDGVQWLLKIHPGEMKNRSVRGVQYLLSKHSAHVPKGMIVVPPDTEINSLDIFRLVDGGVFYIGNTAGEELALMGKRVILAGETLASRHGFTLDARTANEYCEMLRSIPSLTRPTEEEHRRARRHAFLYFMQYHLPLEVMSVKGRAFWDFEEDKAWLLEPGKSEVVEAFCLQMLGNEDVILSTGAAEREHRSSRMGEQED